MNNRIKWRYAAKREERRQSNQFKTVSQYKIDSRINKDDTPDKLTPPTNNPELTIRIKESTVELLKETAYDMDKKGNDHTYDDVIMYLVGLHTIMANNQQNDIVNDIINEHNIIAGDID